MIRGEILTPWHVTILCDIAAALRFEDEKKIQSILINGVGIGDVGQGEIQRGNITGIREVEKETLEMHSDRFGSGRLITGCSDPTLSTLAVFDVY